MTILTLAAVYGLVGAYALSSPQPGAGIVLVACSAGLAWCAGWLNRHR